MKDTKAILKSGETLSSAIWKWRPKLGWFTLIGTDQIFFKDVESMITPGVQFVFDRFEDRDELARAREEGWREG